MSGASAKSCCLLFCIQIVTWERGKSLQRAYESDLNSAELSVHVQEALDQELLYTDEIVSPKKLYP